MAIARKRFQLAGALLIISCFGGLLSDAANASTPVTDQPPDSIRLTSSKNPVQLRTPVVFMATVSTHTPGGTLSFYGNQEPIPGCAAVAMTGSSASCTTSFDIPGSWTVTAEYNYPVSASPASSPALSASITQTVVRGIRVLPTPPEMQIGIAGPRGQPNFRLTLLAIRSTRMPHRFWFALEHVRCINRASYVLVTIGSTTLTDRCGARIELATRSLAVHRFYQLTLRAVRYRNNRIVARGPAYQNLLYMPGNEVHWPAISGVQLPLSPPAT